MGETKFHLSFGIDPHCRLFGDTRFIHLPQLEVNVSPKRLGVTVFNNPIKSFLLNANIISYY